MNEILQQVARGAKVYDLAQTYFVGMPHYPTHPPFLYSLTKKHGEYVTAEGVSSAADAIALGTHDGTHIDALCHFSVAGRLHGGVEAASVQSYEGGIAGLSPGISIDTMPPIVRRGVLLDVAGFEGVSALPEDYAADAKILQAVADRQDVSLKAGDVVLVRTGWGQFWNQPARFLTGGGAEVRCPGPNLDGARWLSSHGVYAVGSDTVVFEKAPGPGLPVHVHLLVEKGIPIIECLQLEELAAERVYEFLLVAAPLKVRGATGAPIRPLAITLT